MKMGAEIAQQLTKLPSGKWVALPGKHWKEYFIVDPAKPLPAIVNVLKNRIVRPDRTGYVSLREIALAQGFAEYYEIVGVLTSQAQQLANAVPVELATTFAKEFFHRLHPDKAKMDHYFQSKQARD
jgi:site-specific DNA-cytosine methylase